MKEIKLGKSYRKKHIFNSGGFSNVHKNQIIRGLDFLTQDISSAPHEFQDDNISKEDEFLKGDNYGAMVKSFTLNKISDCDKFLTKSPMQFKGKTQTIEREKSETIKKNLIDEK